MRMTYNGSKNTHSFIFSGRKTTLVPFQPQQDDKHKQGVKSNQPIQNPSLCKQDELTQVDI
ncbi:hypothetical protein REPUB_Repub02eG0163500 [Reevesia pubescens]